MGASLPHVPSIASGPTRPAREHAPQNVLADAGEIARFYDRASALMRALLSELAAAPDRPRPFPEIEDALEWPHRRIASVLGGVSHLRQTEFGGRRPYHFHDARWSVSGRWEMWMDAGQAGTVRRQRPKGGVFGVLKHPETPVAKALNPLGVPEERDSS